MLPYLVSFCQGWDDLSATSMIARMAYTPQHFPSLITCTFEIASPPFFALVSVATGLSGAKSVCRILVQQNSRRWICIRTWYFDVLVKQRWIQQPLRTQLLTVLTWSLRNPYLCRFIYLSFNVMPNFNQGELPSIFFNSSIVYKQPPKFFHQSSPKQTWRDSKDMVLMVRSVVCWSRLRDPIPLPPWWRTAPVAAVRSRRRVALAAWFFYAAKNRSSSVHTKVLGETPWDWHVQHFIFSCFFFGGEGGK